MANFFEILSSPQYETGGRFNALALPELIYGFTPSGRAEIDRKRKLRNRSQEAGVSQQEAELSQTRSQTGNIDARTAGQELNTRVGNFNFEQLREGATRDKAARMVLPSPAPGIPGELGPEYTALAAPIQQFVQGNEDYGRQKELAGMTMDETRGLQRQGFPITQPGMTARAQDLASRGADATRVSEDARGKQSAAAQVLSQAMLFGGPEMGQAAAQFLERLGFPVMSFQQPPNDAAAIDAEVQRRKGAGQGGRNPAPASYANPATAPTSGTGQPAPPPLQGPQPGRDRFRGEITPNDAIIERLHELLGPTPLLRPGGLKPLLMRNKGYSPEMLQQLQTYMSGIAGGQQGQSFGVDIPGDQFPMSRVSEVLEMIRQLQGGQ